MIKISELTQSTVEALYAINKLLPQLSSNSKGLSMERLSEIADSDNTLLYLGTSEDGRILAMLSLIILKLPTGNKAWIEDVVVDHTVRGKGLGRALMNHAFEQAKKRGVKSIDLTSRPSRQSANKLYQSLGYELRKTNVYRYEFS